MLTAEETVYITVEEAATRAGVSSVTVRRAVKAGKLAYRRRRGTTMLLDGAEVDAWSKSRQEIPQEGQE